jgi:hypothetical protein
MASPVASPRVSNTITVGTMNTLWAAANAASVVRVPSKPVSGASASIVTSRMITRVAVGRSLCIGTRYSLLTRSQYGQDGVVNSTMTGTRRLAAVRASAWKFFA